MAVAAASTPGIGDHVGMPMCVASLGISIAALPSGETFRLSFFFNSPKP